MDLSTAQPESAFGPFMGHAIDGLRPLFTYIGLDRSRGSGPIIGPIKVTKLTATSLDLTQMLKI